MFVEAYTVLGGERIATESVPALDGKQIEECLSELAAHGAIEHEVDRIVHQRRNVHDVTERHIERREVDRLQSAHQCKYALEQPKYLNEDVWPHSEQQKFHVYQSKDALKN